MTLVRYNPLSNFVPGTFGDLLENALKETNANSFTPDVDITKSEKEMQLHIVAPGLEKEDFSIDLNENRLTISGERKLEDKEGVSYIKRESDFGKFSRTFNLTDEINKEKIDASYTNGILKVTLPLIEKKVNKATIKVK
ncbi:Hsp20/alpha crystallin family protein [Fulvivirga sp. RKSG066]|uniref:Hsp20/alpha crystallin family protein n=1 Tax=Fulvivirga aurantia TaxID=2529383 RepID=UPI0012BBE20F|nr:Hsp20/alpha crystallin family protein [Fulvivirga aurantia]MTI22090.1 Hsp20/alpha crystallin family protein [Fulvivirga aurantia]